MRASGQVRTVVLTMSAWSRAPTAAVATRIDASSKGSSVLEKIPWSFDGFQRG